MIGAGRMPAVAAAADHQRLAVGTGMVAVAAGVGRLGQRAAGAVDASRRCYCPSCQRTADREHPSVAPAAGQTAEAGQSC